MEIGNEADRGTILTCNDNCLESMSVFLFEERSALHRSGNQRWSGGEGKQLLLYETFVAIFTEPCTYTEGPSAIPRGVSFHLQ